MNILFKCFHTYLLQGWCNTYLWKGWSHDCCLDMIKKIQILAKHCKISKLVLITDQNFKHVFSFFSILTSNRWVFILINKKKTTITPSFWWVSDRQNSIRREVASVARLAFFSSSRTPICLTLEQKKSNRAAEITVRFCVTSKATSI